MTELVIKYKEFVIPIFTALIMGIGYLLKELSVKKKNKNIALFLLLEILYRISPQLLFKSNKSFSNILEKKLLKHNLPISNKLKDELSKKLLSILSNSFEESYNEDILKYEKKFDEAIMLIASEDPIFAYEINTLSNLRTEKLRRKSYEEQFNIDFAEDITNNKIVQNAFDSYDDVLKLEFLTVFENNIKTLSFKISILTYIKTVFRIRKIRKSIKDSFIDELSPEIEEIIDSSIVSYFESFKSALEQYKESNKEDKNKE